MILFINKFVILAYTRIAAFFIFQKIKKMICIKIYMVLFLVKQFNFLSTTFAGELITMQYMHNLHFLKYVIFKSKDCLYEWLNWVNSFRHSFVSTYLLCYL